jgi:putative ABC transport system substrate-binding protein
MGQDDAEFQARFRAFLQALAILGWTIGRNVRIDTRWTTPNAAGIRRHAPESLTLAPDVILAHGSSAVGALLQETRTVPVVFPVAAGRRSLQRSMSFQAAQLPAAGSAPLRTAHPGRF